MSAALSRRRHEIENLKGRLSNLRHRMHGEAERWEKLATSAGAAFLFAKWKSGGGASALAFGGMEPELTAALAGYLIGPRIGGSTGRLVESAALGIACSYAAQRGAEST